MQDYRYYMFNKPAGCITARKDAKHKTVMDYFSEIDLNNLNPVGRLDKYTEGLLIVTDDGKFNQYLMRPDNHVAKNYFFWALGKLDESHVKMFKEGIFLRNQENKTKPAKLEILKTDKFENIRNIIVGKPYEKIGRNPRTHDVVSGFITITEGKKHQVKRMLRETGCYVVYLKRISIGNLQLDEQLNAGEFRLLTSEELNQFYN